MSRSVSIRFGSGLIAPLGRSRGPRYMFIGRRDHVSELRGGQDHEEREERDEVDAPRASGAASTQGPVRQRVEQRRHRIADHRPPLERRACRRARCAAPSVANPVRPITRNVPRITSVLGLGLDADAVRALDVATPQRPDDPHHEDHAEDVGRARRTPGTRAPCRNFAESGSWWSISRTTVATKSDEEAEVDHRVHDARRRVAQQRLHPDAATGSPRAGCLALPRWCGGRRACPARSSGPVAR